MNARLRSAFTLALGLTASAFVVACSDAATPGGAPAAVASSDGGAGNDGASVAAANVDVVYKGTTATVDVASLPGQDYRGSQVVTLTKVWEASKLSGDLTKLQFDFEGDDGFRPSARDRCKTLITGAQIAQGYILPDTRTLVWDDALGLPGCYSVKLVAKVLVSDAP